jgi:hypothetical protein
MQDKPIVGPRYHCQDSDCKDFNLCGKCADADVHPAGHVLLRFNLPSLDAPPPPVRSDSVPSSPSSPVRSTFEDDADRSERNTDDKEDAREHKEKDDEDDEDNDNSHDGYACKICKVRRRSLWLCI